MNVNIDLIKNRLLIKYPTFGSIIANSIFEESCSENTAATDGKHVYYNPFYVNSLTKDEQVFLFAHEICHIAFDHIFRSENKDTEIWNIATDAVINALLIKDGLPLIKRGINIPGSINYNAEDMYYKLLKEKNNAQTFESVSSNSVPSEIDDVGHDSHCLWKKEVEERKQNKNSNNDEIKRLSEQGEVKTFIENNKVKRENLKKLRDSLISKSYGGNSIETVNRHVRNIEESKPFVDWRILLKETTKFDVDWSYQNATIENGVLTPSLEMTHYPETEILLDTSGSVDDNLLKSFLMECKNILFTSNIKVGCFDTKFYGFHSLKSKIDIENLPLLGGGGTDFDVAVNAFSNRVENKIIFTDGNADMPSKFINAIWIVYGDKRINPNGGTVIYISEDELKRMTTSLYIGKVK